MENKYGTRGTVFTFHSHENAIGFASKGRALWVVLAEVGTWLVVTPADAARLERQGYEIL
jgi:hypothetical protein